MKNFWLDRIGPKKTKINIWVSAGASITGQEELLESFETVVPKTEVVFLRKNKDEGVYDVTKYNPMTAISCELDNMLYHRRIGKALAKRYEEGHFNGKPLSFEVMKAQWTPGEGNKLFKEEKLNPNNKLMPFYVFHIRNEAAYKAGATAGYIDKTDWKAVKDEV